MRRHGWLTAAVLISAGAASSARADPRSDGIGVTAQPISYSVAVGGSDGHVFGHMWLGTGVRWSAGAGAALFSLLGVEADLRDGPEPKTHGALRMSERSSRDNGIETWLAMRTGIGHYGAGGFAPHVAGYLIAGWRAIGAPDVPAARLGLGVSVPALLPLAELGIPTMIEGGVDFGGRERAGIRGFLRAGWNF